jgi:hypothetical protein
MSIATPSPPDRPTGNGQRLAAVVAGIRAITPIPTQGKGSFRRTPYGYTLPANPAHERPRTPWELYAKDGFLYLQPGIVNGKVPTTEDGTPLDSYPPPPLLSGEDLETRDYWIVIEARYQLNVRTLQWPRYDEETGELIGYTPFPGVVDGSPLIDLVIRTLTETPIDLSLTLGGEAFVKRFNSSSQAVFYINPLFYSLANTRGIALERGMPASGAAKPLLSYLTGSPLYFHPAIDPQPYPLPIATGPDGADWDWTRVNLQTANFSQHSGWVWNLPE